MPYDRQTAGKGGHADFVRNPDIKAFLADCDYMRVPSDLEAQAITSSFQAAPSGTPPRLPDYVVASDASKSDTPISEKLPSTQIGYIKVSHVLITMGSYSEMIDPKTRFVDPFKAAELHRNAAPITFTLPGSNIRYKNAKSVKDGFRRAVFHQLDSNKSNGGSSQLKLSDMLLILNNKSITLEQCPSCLAKHSFSFNLAGKQQVCPTCGEPVFATDWLRLHEDVSDFGDNTSAMTRMMNAVEHLLLAALIWQVFEADPRALAKMAFVMDGPLAVFGQPAKLHARMMELIFNVKHEAKSAAAGASSNTRPSKDRRSDGPRQLDLKISTIRGPQGLG